MRRLTMAVFICSSVALAALSSVTPGVAVAQSPTPTPTPSSSPSSPAPTSSSTPSADPTPSPTQTSPAPSPTDDPASTDEIPAVVDIRVNPTGGVAELGEHLSYSLLVVNPGDASLHELTITNVVPEELDVAGVPIVDAAASINLISSGSSEQIVWTLNELAAGEGVTLPWEASVSSTGDLVAENNVTVRTENSSASASRNVYLARSSTPVVQGGTASAARSAVETRRVVHYEQRRVPAGSAPAALPMTGAIISGWFLLALILIGAGVAFIRVRRSPLLLCALMSLVVMAACTNAGSPPPSGAGSPENQTPSSDDSDAEDRVLGTRIRRAENESAAPKTAGDQASTDTTSIEETTDQLPVPQEDLIQVVTVPVVEVVEVQAPASEVLTSLQGENLVTFSWDESNREVTDAASSRTLSRESSATLLAALATASPTIAPSVELVNLSAGSLVVKGELGIKTLGSNGEAAATLSEHLDLVLAPGGSVSLDFEYILPSGDYSSVPFFQAD